MHKPSTESDHNPHSMSSMYLTNDYNKYDNSKIGKSKCCWRKYGFIREPGVKCDTEIDRCGCNNHRSVCETNSRDIFHIDSWDTPDFLRSHIAELEDAVLREGIPRVVRGHAWMNLLDIHALLTSSTFDYKASLAKLHTQLEVLGISEYAPQDAQKVLSATNPSPCDDNPLIDGVSKATLRQIFCDIDRTYTEHAMFHPSEERSHENMASLFRVLAVYSMYNSSLGYCQGMSYIAGVLLMHLSESDSFWCLVAMLDRSKYLQGFYDVPLSKIQRYGKVFGKLVKSRFPQLYGHLKNAGVSPVLYVTPWFMSLFTNLSCWDAIMCIWDLFIMHGISALFRVALAILELCQPDILATSDLCHIMPYLLKPPVKVCQRDVLMTAVSHTHVDDWEIDNLIAVVAENEANQRKRKASGNNHIDPAKRGRGSLFKRLTYMFTPKNTNTTHSKHLIRRNHSSPSLIGQHLLKKYIERSTRGKLTFRSFNTPQPLRQSQVENIAQHQNQTFQQLPDVELRPIQPFGRIDQSNKTVSDTNPIV